MEKAAAKDTVLAFLRSRGWRLRSDEVTLQILDSLSGSDLASEQLLNIVETQLLDVDLNTCGAKSLPDASSLPKLTRLQGPLVLQVVSVKDICQSNYRGKFLTQQSGSRLLRFHLTDGQSKITGIEYQPIHSISEEIAPGTKVCIEGCVPVQSGILLLESSHLRLLGGIVQSLYEEWEIEHKYSTYSLPLVNSTHDQNSSPPPRFQKLQIEPSVEISISHKPLKVPNAKSFPSPKPKEKHGAGKLLTGVNINSDTPRQANLALTTDMAACDRDKNQKPKTAVPLKSGRSMNQKIRAGYELYRVKTVQPKPEDALESFSQPDETSCSGFEGNKSEVLKRNEKLVDEESQDMISKENQATHCEEAGQDRKTLPATEVMPVQNQAAAQKLLRTMADRGKEVKDFKSGKFHRSRGRRQEENVLTLDEWELQKMNTMSTSNRTTDISQDEKLARELQRKLDLEASNESMHVGNEAENIRRSIFNFGNMGSSSNENSTRKHRGRGKGKRRF